jgi:hypothetical protein
MILISLFVVIHRFGIVFPNKSLFFVICSSSHQYIIVYVQNRSSIEHKVFINNTSTRVSLLEQLTRCAVNLYIYYIKKKNII